MAGFTDDYANLLDILGLGANDYLERLQPTIKFTSPEGREFEAKWIGSPRRLDKKLGIYSYPIVKGDVVDDLGVSSNIWPLTFFFDGKDNDKTSRAFMYAIKETGRWNVIHPVHGFLGLVPVSCEAMDAPVESGNVTAITSEWIEDIDPDTEQTAREMAGIVDELSTGTGIDALDAFLEAISLASETLSKTLSLTTRAINNASEIALSPLAAVNDLVYNAQLDTQRAIQSTLDAVVLRPTELGAQIQDLITQPALAMSDIESRLDYYDDMQNELEKTLPPDGINSQIPSHAPAAQQKNATATTELALNAVTQARATIAITGPIRSRRHAVDIAIRLVDGFDSINSSLENVQTLLQTESIENQYFAGLALSTKNLLGQTLRYLFRVLYDLKAERKIKTKKWVTTMEITVDEYGQLGENDEYLDLFIESNNLEGDERIFLAPGREVVVYV